MPGGPAQTRLLRAVLYRSDDLRMPPKGRLKDSEIADLEVWVKAGAVWPEAAASDADRSKPRGEFTEEQKRFWAFQPMKNHVIPAVRDPSWVCSPVDALVLGWVVGKGWRAKEQADR